MSDTIKGNQAQKETRQRKLKPVKTIENRNLQ